MNTNSSEIHFFINKSFANLALIPQAGGICFVFKPFINGSESTDPDAGYLEFLLPKAAVGGLWATAKAFMFAVESLDENIGISATQENRQTSDIMLKLYRDKPAGANGKLAGSESCWLRLVNGRSEAERRRIKLGPKDLLNLELACQTAATI